MNLLSVCFLLLPLHLHRWLLILGFAYCSVVIPSRNRTTTTGTTDRFFASSSHTKCGTQGRSSGRRRRRRSGSAADKPRLIICICIIVRVSYRVLVWSVTHARSNGLHLLHHRFHHCRLLLLLLYVCRAATAEFNSRCTNRINCIMPAR